MCYGEGRSISMNSTGHPGVRTQAAHDDRHDFGLAVPLLHTPPVPPRAHTGTHRQQTRRESETVAHAQRNGAMMQQWGEH